MRPSGFAVVAPCLALVGPAHGDDDGAPATRVRLEALGRLRTHYEQMLRDARTGTAARYFLERLAALERQRRDLEGVAAEQPAPGPPAPMLQHAQAWLREAIRQRIERRDATLADVTAWTRRELPDAFLLHVAAVAERTAWVLEHFVENAGLFDVGDAVEPRPCPACGGQGWIRRHGNDAHPDGLCPRCAGVGHDAILRYR